MSGGSKPFYFKARNSRSVISSFASEPSYPPVMSLGYVFLYLGADANPLFLPPLLLYGVFTYFTSLLNCYMLPVLSWSSEACDWYDLVFLSKNDCTICYFDIVWLFLPLWHLCFLNPNPQEPSPSPWIGLLVRIIKFLSRYNRCVLSLDVWPYLLEYPLDF